MKFITIIFLIFFFVGCNTSDEQNKSDLEKTREEPLVEWLAMEGRSNMPKVVLISGDEEYRSEEALPQLAKILTQHHGFNCTVLFAQDPAQPGIVDPNYVQNIPGLDHLQSADLMILFTRFRALPEEQMKYIDDYLKSGKPVIGMRTSTHAFNFSKIDSTSIYRHYGNYYDQDDPWKGGFGRLVLGEKWISHHGKHGDQSTRGIAAPGQENHPILNGIEAGDIWGATDVYGVRSPLPGDSQPVIFGQVVDREGDKNENDPRLGMRPSDQKLPDLVAKKDDEGNEISVNKNDPMMPVAWIKSYQIPDGIAGKCFSTTMGASTDLIEPGTRRMLANAVFWCLDLDVPDQANVDVVGTYSPTRFAFHKDIYWDEKNLKVSSLK